MRIALAKLLLEKPNLLLLDEPTNHLDLEARNWLEEYLAAYPYAFVLVSHDRYFMDVTVRKVVELWNKAIHLYTGGYSKYETLMTERGDRVARRLRPPALPDFLIERGDRVALVGVNGAGKSTLIKILAGAEPVTAGEYILGHNAQPDYFAQDQYKELDQSARMIDDLALVAPRATNTELRSILGSFLFSEDDVFKQIGVLSGGERNRYALAR